MYWLAEQGLVPKKVLLVVIPLVTIFLMEHIKRVFEKNGNMGKMKNALDALIVNLGCIIDLGGSVAGSALLANVF